MTRTSDFNSNDLRALNDIELEQVSGGIYDDGGCIHRQTIVPGTIPAPWNFKDVFATPVLGQ